MRGQRDSSTSLRCAQNEMWGGGRAVSALTGVTCGGRCAALEMTCGGEGEGRFPNRLYGLLGMSASTA